MRLAHDRALLSALRSPTAADPLAATDTDRPDHHETEWFRAYFGGGGGA